MISLLKSGARLKTLFLQKREEFELHVYVFGFKVFLSKNDTVVILYRHSVLLNSPWFEMGVSVRLKHSTKANTLAYKITSSELHNLSSNALNK